MKSRVLKNEDKIILAYGFVGERLETLLGIAKENHIKVRQVMPSEVDNKPPSLLNTSPLILEEYPSNCEEVIILAHFSSSSMEKFVDSLNSRDFNVSLKALLTPTNQTWTFKTLMEKLKNEYDRLSKK
jgi:hypothetical protein